MLDTTVATNSPSSASKPSKDWKKETKKLLFEFLYHILYDIWTNTLAMVFAQVNTIKWFVMGDELYDLGPIYQQ